MKSWFKEIGMWVLVAAISLMMLYNEVRFFFSMRNEPYFSLSVSLSNIFIWLLFFISWSCQFFEHRKKNRLSYLFAMITSASLFILWLIFMLVYDGWIGSWNTILGLGVTGLILIINAVKFKRMGNELFLVKVQRNIVFISLLIVAFLLVIGTIWYFVA